MFKYNAIQFNYFELNEQLLFPWNGSYKPGKLPLHEEI